MNILPTSALTTHFYFPRQVPTTMTLIKYCTLAILLCSGALAQTESRNLRGQAVYGIADDCDDTAGTNGAYDVDDMDCDDVVAVGGNAYGAGVDAGNAYVAPTPDNSGNGDADPAPEPAPCPGGDNSGSGDADPASEPTPCPGGDNSGNGDADPAPEPTPCPGGDSSGDGGAAPATDAYPTDPADSGYLQPIDTTDNNGEPNVYPDGGYTPDVYSPSPDAEYAPMPDNGGLPDTPYPGAEPTDSGPADAYTPPTNNACM